MPNLVTPIKRERCHITTDESRSVLSFLYKIAVIRCVVKWIIHLLTGTCELQRVVNKYKGGTRTLKVESCMLHSKTLFLSELVEKEPGNIEAAIIKVMTLKNIVPELNSSFLASMKTCLEQIYGYDALRDIVEGARAEKYNAENKLHEEMLLQLWDLLQPNEALKTRVTKQWGNIGFQGDDPKTDFRGMGMLGLLNLLYFAEHHTDKARLVLLHSHHPKYGYSYAVVGINITGLAFELLASGLLRSHFFNNVAGRPEMKDFNKVFCYLFFEFDKFWMKSEPENVMAFGRILDEFRRTIESILKYASTAHLILESVAKE